MNDLSDLIELFLKELREGKAPPAEKFAACYPWAEAELLELLPALLALESAGGESSALAAAEARVDYPERLGEFLLGEQIGQGGMGVVFRAVQESLHRTVAVKILFPVWNSNERQLQLFENESKLIARLRHTHIVEIYGAGSDRGFRYYVMALIHGEPLSRKYLQDVLPCVPFEQAVARVALQAAEALAYAHQHGIVHRDIKPSNLLVDREGNVYVSDFGLATTLNEGEGAPLVTRSHDGTLRYMAPERLLQDENGFAADQYSLGVTLYELLAEHPAYAEQTPGRLIRRICEGPLPPLPAHGSDLAAIVNKSIAFSPSDRYTGMSEMARDLRRLLRGEPIEAHPASSWRKLKLWAKRRPTVATLTGVSIFLLLASLSVVSFSYARVSHAFANENAHRQIAEDNAGIADAALNRVFNRMIGQRHEENELPPSRAHARLLQDLMPYYEEIASRRETPKAGIGEAKKNLAQIAMQIGDTELASQNFREAAALLQPDSFDSVFCRNELALCLAAQNKRSEALSMLLHLADQYEQSPAFDIRLETVRSLQSAARMSHRPPHQGIPDARPAQERRRPPQKRGKTKRRSIAGLGSGLSTESHGLYERAGRLLSGLLQEHPDHAGARLMQAVLLGEAPYLREALLPAGSAATPCSILESLIQESPDTPRYLMAYVRLAQTARLTDEYFDRNVAIVRRALDYLNTLLEILPGDFEVLTRFLTLRQKYANALSERGMEEESNKESERTLGMLNLLTARPDFSPELREKLVNLLIRRHSRNRRPAAEDAERLNEEIRLLMRSCDAGRVEKFRRHLRDAKERRRHARPHRR